MRKHVHNNNYLPFSRPYSNFPPLQAHKTVQSINDLKNMFPDFLNRIGCMPGEYFTTLDVNILPVMVGAEFL